MFLPQSRPILATMNSYLFHGSIAVSSLTKETQMKNKTVLAALITAAFAMAPLAPAHAEGHHPHGGRNSGLFFGLFAASVTGAALALATSPHTVVVETPPPPPPQPIYVAPAPIYYEYVPVYRPAPVYPHRHVVTYGYPYHTYTVYR
jgi:hypothetical protein